MGYIIHFAVNNCNKTKNEVPMNNNIDVSQTEPGMDDIQDNSFFYDYLEKKKIKNFKIFQYERKFVGLILDNLKL